MALKLPDEPGLPDNVHMHQWQIPSGQILRSTVWVNAGQTRFWQADCQAFLLDADRSFIIGEDGSPVSSKRDTHVLAPSQAEGAELVVAEAKAQALALSLGLDWSDEPDPEATDG